MSNSANTSQAKFIEKTDSAIENAKTHPVIAPLLVKFGYDTPKLEEGSAICATAKAAYDFNSKEDKETNQAQIAFDTSIDAVKADFFKDKELCGRLFRKEPEILVELGTGGSTPRNFELFVNKATSFYTTIANSESIQQRTQLIDLGAEQANARLLKVEEMVQLKRKYVTEEGESQNATKTKDSAILELKEWYSDLENIAHIALYDQPQLLEVLGIFVRS